MRVSAANARSERSYHPAFCSDSLLDPDPRVFGRHEFVKSEGAGK
jgi:hypothetical protein